MAISVPLPAPFMPCPGEPAISFPTWLKMLENYMLVIGATRENWPEERKCAVLLLHAVGTEGQRPFSSLPSTGTVYTSGMEAFKKHFISKINVIVEHHKFHQRAQCPHESINHCAS